MAIPVITSLSTVTQDTTPSIAGTATALAVVHIYLDGVDTDTAEADAMGDWTYTFGVLTDDAYEITATEEEGMDESEPSNAITITVDTTAPAVPVITTADLVTNDTTPTIAGTAEANATVHIYQDDIDVDTTSANGSGAWTYTFGALAEGVYEITATAEDEAGNEGDPSEPMSLTIDTTATEVVDVTSTNDDGSYGVGRAISITVEFDEAVVVSGVPTLALNNGGTASYLSGSGTDTLLFRYTVAESDDEIDLDYDATDSLNVGEGSIKDIAGNDADLTLPTPGDPGSLGDNKELVIDGTFPAAPVITTNSFNTASHTPTIYGTAEADAVIKVYDNESLNGTTEADGSGDWSYTWTYLPDGIHAVQAVAVDAALNTSELSNEISVMFAPDGLVYNISPALSLGSADKKAPSLPHGNATNPERNDFFSAE